MNGLDMGKRMDSLSMRTVRRIENGRWTVMCTCMSVAVDICGVFYWLQVCSWAEKWLSRVKSEVAKAKVRVSHIFKNTSSSVTVNLQWEQWAQCFSSLALLACVKVQNTKSFCQMNKISVTKIFNADYSEYLNYIFFLIYW